VIGDLPGEQGAPGLAGGQGERLPAGVG